MPGCDLSRTDVHNDRSDHTKQQTGRETHDRSGGQSSQHIVEKTLHTACENILLALFGVITLDHANPSERLRQPTGDFSINFAALAKDRTDSPKSFVERQSKEQQESERDGGHEGTDAEQHDQRDSRSHQASDQIDQSSTDQVADAFDIAHDARDQHAAFGRIVKRDWQPADMRLNFLTELRDQPLRGLRQQLGQRKRCDSLNHGGGQHAQHQRLEQLSVVFDDDAVDQVFGGIGKHEIRKPD